MTHRIAVTAEQCWHRVPGGTARAVARTITTLLRTTDVELIGIAASHRRPPEVPLPIPVVHHRLPRPALYESWVRSDRFGIDELVGPVDAVWAAAMVAPPSERPVVVTIHDVDFLTNRELLSRRGRRFLPAALESAARRADLVVCPSATVATACADAGIDETVVRTVPWGVDAAVADRQSTAAARARFGLPDDYVLWVGTIEPRKNLARLVAAMMLVPDVPLVVVGPEGWIVDGHDLLAPLGDRALRLGVVDEEALRSIYSGASVFAFPSLAEGFGLPVLEAMAQSTAVITSSGTATAEVAGDAALLVDPSDTEAIAAAISRVLADDVLRADLESRGQARTGSFSWDATAAGYGRAFREVIDR